MFFDDLGEFVRFYSKVPYAVEGDLRHYLKMEEFKVGYGVLCGS